MYTLSMNNSDTDIINYYNCHSAKQTRETFNISYYVLNKILDNNNIPHHSQSDNMRYDGNGFQRKREQEFEELIKSINVEDFYSYYLSHAKKDTANKYNISEFMVNKILDYNNLTRLSPYDAKVCCFKNTYGSYEEGVKIASEKTKNATEYNEVTKKRAITNSVRYGGPSPFSSQAVRDKSKETVKQRFGVDNVFQSEEIKRKIRQSQLDKYGGVGWESPELLEKFSSTMKDKYGVKYACLLPQCYNAKHGSNSKPNLSFKKALDLNNISCSTEFIIDNFRFDFKVGTNLIEINPAYTHNSTVGYKGQDGIDKFYHCHKSLAANKNGFNCIHVWDWDNTDKIISMLKSKTTLYARKCKIKEVDKSTSQKYLDKNHLQGYVKDSIRIGLFNGEELVSLMTFGKPRYNKNYQYELLRYCSTYAVCGGAEKLFKYFIENYSPSSVISYCDRSKFTGNVYKKLGFASLRNPSPSKHWYNLKTKKHITDNLLRQRGFDQLLGSKYGCFGKDTSNEVLMKAFGFVEIYDCGQETFVYKK